MKQAWFLFHILLLTLVAYLGTDLLYAPFDADPDYRKLSPESVRPALLEPGGSSKTISNGEKQTVILARNLFNVLPSVPKHPDRPLPGDQKVDTLKPTQLNLALWGTVTGAGTSAAWAVIEDRKEKIQALYEVGDAVAGATIKKIMRNKVILNYQNQDQVLEVDPSLTPSHRPASPVIQSPISQSPARLFQNQTATAGPLSGISPDLMKQVRIRPFFREGKAQGMLLYGIRPESTFQKMGLRNGDIIQQINNTQTLRATDARAVYQSAASQDETRMVLLRRGKKIQLMYNPTDNTHTTEAVSNE